MSKFMRSDRERESKETGSVGFAITGIECRLVSLYHITFTIFIKVTTNLYVSHQMEMIMILKEGLLIFFFSLLLGESNQFYIA